MQVLFTASYPFCVAAEQTFLDLEIEYLVKAFDRVVLVPRNREGARLPVPAGVEVEESYSSLLNSANKLIAGARAFFSPHFYGDLFIRPSLLYQPTALMRLFAFLGGAILTQRWVEAWIEREMVDTSQAIFYTYWFDQAAMGIGLAKKRYPRIALVSRAHGYDLYEEVYDLPFWPCRRAALAFLDGLFPDSEAGTRYLKTRYPDFSPLYETARLGVSDPGFLSRPSRDKIFRIVSCSMIRPVKRVDLLLEGVACVARMRLEQCFEWRHFGDGERRGALQTRADATFPPNARGFLPGYTNQEDLLRTYRDDPIDVFINVSESEGTPVSVMEAISCGIPIVATAVGGNAEIASEQNGLLLSPNPKPEEIAEAFLKLLDNPELAAAKRKGSRGVWQERYNANDNFQAFADRLKAIRQSE